MFYICDDKNVTAEGEELIVPWWSFGKTVLATSVLLLVEEGKLDLYRKYFGLEANLYQILRHEGGLKDYGSVKAYGQAVNQGDEPWSPAEMLDRADGYGYLYPPGEGWMYSNIGYYFIRKLLEETMGMPLQSVINTLIFDSLEGASCKVCLEKEDLVGVSNVRDGYSPGWLYHGMLVGSLQSAGIMLHALARGRILSETSLALMKNVYPLKFDVGDRPWTNTSYGLGIMAENSDGEAYHFGHTGQGPDSVFFAYHYGNDLEPFTVIASGNSLDQGVVEWKGEHLARDYRTSRK